MATDLETATGYSSADPVISTENKKDLPKLWIILGVSVVGILLCGGIPALIYFATNPREETRTPDGPHTSELDKKLATLDQEIKSEISLLERDFDISHLSKLESDIKQLKLNLSGADPPTRSKFKDFILKALQDIADKCVSKINEMEIEEQKSPIKPAEASDDFKRNRELLDGICDLARELMIPLKPKLTLKAYREAKNLALLRVGIYLRSVFLDPPDITTESLNELIKAIPLVIEPDNEPPVFTTDDDTPDEIIKKIYKHQFKDIKKEFPGVLSLKPEEERKAIASTFASRHKKYGDVGPEMVFDFENESLLPDSGLTAKLDQEIVEQDENIKKNIADFCKLKKEAINNFIQTVCEAMEKSPFTLGDYFTALHKALSNLPSKYEPIKDETIPVLTGNFNAVQIEGTFFSMYFKEIKDICLKKIETYLGEGKILKARTIFDNLISKDSSISEKFDNFVIKFAPKLGKDKLGKDEYGKCISYNIDLIYLQMEEKAEWAKVLNHVPLFNSCITRRVVGVVDPDYPVPIVKPLDFIKELAELHSTALLQQVDSEFLSLFRNRSSSLGKMFPIKQTYLNVKSYLGDEPYHLGYLDGHLLAILLKPFYGQVRERAAGASKTDLISDFDRIKTLCEKGDKSCKLYVEDPRFLSNSYEEFELLFINDRKEFNENYEKLEITINESKKFSDFALSDSAPLVKEVKKLGKRVYDIHFDVTKLLKLFEAPGKPIANHDDALWKVLEKSTREKLDATTRYAKEDQEPTFPADYKGFTNEESILDLFPSTLSKYGNYKKRYEYLKYYAISSFYLRTKQPPLKALNLVKEFNLEEPLICNSDNLPIDSILDYFAALKTPDEKTGFISFLGNLRDAQIAHAALNGEFSFAPKILGSSIYFDHMGYLLKLQHSQSFPYQKELLDSLDSGLKSNNISIFYHTLKQKMKGKLIFHINLIRVFDKAYNEFYPKDAIVEKFIEIGAPLLGILPEVLKKTESIVLTQIPPPSAPSPQPVQSKHALSSSDEAFLVNLLANSAIPSRVDQERVVTLLNKESARTGNWSKEEVTTADLETKRNLLRVLFRPLLAYFSKTSKIKFMNVRQIANNPLPFIDNGDIDALFSDNDIDSLFSYVPNSNDPNEVLNVTLKKLLEKYHELKDLLAYCLDKPLDLSKITKDELNKLIAISEKLTIDRLDELGMSKSEYKKIKKNIKLCKKAAIAGEKKES